MIQSSKWWIFLCLAIVVWLPTSAAAQTGFRRMPPGKLAVGMGYQRYRPPTRTDAPFRFHAQTLLGNLDYAFNRDLKLSLLPGVSFLMLSPKTLMRSHRVRQLIFDSSTSTT